jgi:hypothetical protein
VHTSQIPWRTSSFSGTNGNGCVEVAFIRDAVAVRDTKDRTRVPHTFGPGEWSAFLAGLRAGDFTRGS